MTTTPDDHKRARFQGEAFARSYLSNLVQAGTAVELAESFTGGMLTAARAFLSTFVSERAAYEALQAEADRAAAPRVTGTSNAPEQAE